MEGRKAILATLGLAFLAAGIPLAGSAIAAIIDAPPNRNLIVAWVRVGLAVLMIGIGVYVFTAAITERLWLPGMKAVRHAANEHALAEVLLTLAAQRGNKLAERSGARLGFTP